MTDETRSQVKELAASLRSALFALDRIIDAEWRDPVRDLEAVATLEAARDDLETVIDWLTDAS